MTREEAKELLPIIQAFAEGKTIEHKGKGSSFNWEEVIEPIFNLHMSEYRIKPEPKYRPFKDVEECWQEMLKHQPFGWVRVINRYKNILELRDSKNGIELLEENWPYKDLCKRVTFADGTPFGIREC